jgi:O-antigen/teichoic acid export membrane protein
MAGRTTALARPGTGSPFPSSDAMNVLQRVTKNTLAMLISNAVNLALGFTYAAYSARYLGPDGYGVIGTALALTSLFGFLTDLGIGQLMVREVARNKWLAIKFVGNVLIIKLILNALTFLSIVLAANILGYSALTKSVVYIITLSVAINAFNSIFTSIFQAYEKIEYISINSIINSVLMLAGAFLAINYGLDVIGFAFTYLFVSIICLLYSIGILFSKFFTPRIEADLNFWKSTISEALSFGLNGLFVSIYYWIAPVMLSYIKGSEAVGLYNAAFRLILVSLFLPTILSTSLFPVMSQFYVTAKDSMRLAYYKNFKYMAILAIPMGVGTTLLADRIIYLIFGSAFIDSANVLRILIWSAVFIFLSSASTMLLQSSNKQKTLMKITGLCAIINIIMNILLIPYYSYLGASIAATTTEFLALILVTISCAGIGYGLSKKSLCELIKIAGASLFMAGFIIFLRDLSLPALIPLSAISYFLVLYMLKGFEANDVEMFKSALTYLLASVTARNKD